MGSGVRWGFGMWEPKKKSDLDIFFFFFLTGMLQSSPLIKFHPRNFTYLDLEKGLDILTTYPPHAPKMPLSLNGSSKALLPKVLFYCVTLAPYDPKSLPELLHMINHL